MSDATENTDGYLPVLHMWAKEEFLRLCAAVANAASETEKQERIAALKLDAPRLTAIMVGVEIAQDADEDGLVARMMECETLVTDMEEQVEEMTGQLGVAVDLVTEILSGTSLTAAHRAAMEEWLTDIAESKKKKEPAGEPTEPSSN